MDRGAAGSKGGRTTLERHGVEHFRQLGKLGIRATADRYFAGSIPNAMEWLRKRGYELQMAAGVDAKLGAMIEAGQKVACEELPVVCEPDGDPSYWRSLVRDP